MSGVEVRRSERDGCQCPPWTLRCVHFEGQILVIADYVKPDQHTCYLSGPVRPRYKVLQVSGYTPCGIDGCLVLKGNDPNPWPLAGTDDLPAAEEEFERRADELRQAPVGEHP